MPMNTKIDADEDNVVGNGRRRGRASWNPTQTRSLVGLIAKNLAPGEARTPDLRISLSVLTYKYDALTDCATGAMLGRLFPPD